MNNFKRALEAMGADNFNQSHFNMKRTNLSKGIIPRPNTGKQIEQQINIRIGSAFGHRGTVSKRFAFFR